MSTIKTIFKDLVKPVTEMADSLGYSYKFEKEDFLDIVLPLGAIMLWGGDRGEKPNENELRMAACSNKHAHTMMHFYNLADPDCMKQILEKIKEWTSIWERE